MWMKRAKYCPACATGLHREPVGGRDRLRCPGCGLVLFQNPASATAAVVLDGRRRVLLIRRAIEPFRDHWALPAGYQEVDETPAEAARREVLEETGIEIETIRLLDLVFIPDDPRKPANLAIFLCRPMGGELCAGDDASEVAWYSLEDLPEDIGFDNRERILLPLLQDPERFGLDPGRD